MKRILKNKKGIGLPLILAVVTFVFALVATLLTVAVSQARLVEISIESSEEYVNAVQAVDATLQIIVRDQNLDSAYLTTLEAYMGVTITVLGPDLYEISHPVTTTRSVKSYVTASIGGVAVSTYDTVFQYSGQEPSFLLNPLVTPTSLLASYIPQYIETNFSGVIPQTEFTDFDSIVSYISTLASQGVFTLVTATFLQNQANPTALGHYYINGNVVIANYKSLTVPNNRLLVINGNLTMNRGSTITGNVVVNGDVTINGNKNTTESIQGTLYINGKISDSRDVTMGTSLRPTFIFLENDFEIRGTVTGYLYVLCRNFDESKITIIGGVYAENPNSIPTGGISANPSLNTSLFYNYGLPITLSSDPAVSGETSFLYTYPR